MHSPRTPIAYRIQTRRMVLRCWNPADAPLLREAIVMSLEHLRPWMNWAQREPESVEAKAERLRRFREDFDRGRDFAFGMFDQNEREVLGSIGLHRRIGDGALEIGYWVRADRIRQGLATEAAAALVRTAFEIGRARRIEIHCDPANIASAGVPRKLGFTCQVVINACVRSPLLGPRDSAIWVLTREDYGANPAASAEFHAFDAIGTPISLPGE